MDKEWNGSVDLPDSSMPMGMFETCNFCVDLATDARGTENLFCSFAESDPISPDPLKVAWDGILNFCFYQSRYAYRDQTAKDNVSWDELELSAPMNHWQFMLRTHDMQSGHKE